MNKKRKILTLVALAVFGVIIALHYVVISKPYVQDRPVIENVAVPVFALAVFYAGLFFLFGGKDADPVPRRPRNWRGISGVVLLLLVAAGMGTGMIHSYEVEKRNEATRQANIEEEDSKHRITSSEIDLIDLRLGPLYAHGFYQLTGRIRNRAAHERTLNSITLVATLREKEGSPDIVGVQTVQIRVQVPPYQTRAISETIQFPNLPQLTQPAWTYFISEIRGDKGINFVPIVPNVPLDFLPNASPTP